MLPRADLGATRPPASIEAPTRAASATDSRQELFQRLSQIAIGRQLQIDVLSLLDDGTYLVKVADTTARMNLPVGTKVGDSMPMTLVAKEPRPTFLLAASDGKSATASLSNAGRLVDHILQTAQQSGAPAVVAGRTPLVASPAAMDPQQVSAALHDAVEYSGLFYEAHLQEWTNGSRPLADLKKEPQAGLEPRLPRPAAAEAPNGALAQVAGRMRELADGVHTLVDLIREAQTKAAGSPADALAITHSDVSPKIEPEAARVINLQLDAMEHRHLRWQGELWPGQRMEWEVSEDPPESTARGEAPQPVWTSVVRFEMPTLGPVSATVRLVGDRVHVQVSAASDTAAAALRGNGDALADALQAAGSPLDSFTVKRDEPA